MRPYPYSTGWTPAWPKMDRHARKAFHRTNEARRLRGEKPLPKPMTYYGGL